MHGWHEFSLLVPIDQEVKLRAAELFDRALGSRIAAARRASPMSEGDVRVPFCSYVLPISASGTYLESRPPVGDDGALAFARFRRRAFTAGPSLVDYTHGFEQVERTSDFTA